MDTPNPSSRLAGLTLQRTFQVSSKSFECWGGYAFQKKWQNCCLWSPFGLHQLHHAEFCYHWSDFNKPEIDYLVLFSSHAALCSCTRVSTLFLTEPIMDLLAWRSLFLLCVVSLEETHGVCFRGFRWIGNITKCQYKLASTVFQLGYPYVGEAYWAV